MPARGPSAPSVRMVPLSSASWMNSAGQEDPVIGWFQRTRASAPTMRPVGQRDQGLVVDLHLAPVDHVVEGGVEVESVRPTACPSRSTSNIADVAAPAAFLGAVHRHVGVVQEVVARLAGLAQRHPDAHGGDDLVPVAQRDRVAQRVEDRRWRPRRRRPTTRRPRAGSTKSSPPKRDSVSPGRTASPQALSDDAQAARRRPGDPGCR